MRKALAALLVRDAGLARVGNAESAGASSCGSSSGVFWDRREAHEVGGNAGTVQKVLNALLTRDADLGRVLVFRR